MTYKKQARDVPLKQAHPLLDSENKPTESLIYYANAMFDYLDRNYKPKCTGFLELSKMEALMILKDSSDPNWNREFSVRSFWVHDMEFLAFSIETVFRVEGPLVTRGGFLTFVRSEILRYPDAIFEN
ncbi:hypothetical protein BGZ83_007657 [Gryganskiella cystojenkinii]|nr:hypothetical protein BGZ83_007657 [Gryganskiella cystojenkinii]